MHGTHSVYAPTHQQANQQLGPPWTQPRIRQWYQGHVIAGRQWLVAGQPELGGDPVPHAVDHAVAVTPNFTRLCRITNKW